MPFIRVKLVDQQHVTVALSGFLKKYSKVKLLERVDVINTRYSKELAPFDLDWYYTRGASLPTHIYIRSPVRVSIVFMIYGGHCNNGSLLSHWCIGSGSIARKSLQSPEQLKIMEKDPNGRCHLNFQGCHDLNRIAAQVANAGLPPKK